MLDKLKRALLGEGMPASKAVRVRAYNKEGSLLFDGTVREFLDVKMADLER